MVVQGGWELASVSFPTEDILDGVLLSVFLTYFLGRAGFVRRNDARLSVFLVEARVRLKSN